MTTDSNTTNDQQQPPADDQRDTDQPQQSIPYARFRAVLDRAKSAEAEIATLRATGDTPAPTGDNSPPSGPDVSPEQDRDYAALQAKHDAVASELASLKLARARDRAAVANGIPLDLATNIVGDTEDAIAAEAARLKGFIGQQPKAPRIDGDTRGHSAGRVYTKAEISDPAFFAAHHDHIMVAMGAGRVKWD